MNSMTYSISDTYFYHNKLISANKSSFTLDFLWLLTMSVLVQKKKSGIKPIYFKTHIPKAVKYISQH